MGGRGAHRRQVRSPPQWGRVWLSHLGGAPGIEWVEPRMLLLQHPQSLDGPLRGCQQAWRETGLGIDSGLSQPEDVVSALPAAPGSPRGGEALC